MTNVEDRLQHQLSPYPRDQLVPEVSANGEIDWRASWWNEITKLQQFTNDQEKQNVGPEWYRYTHPRLICHSLHN